jgi:hypothetical protein
MMHKPLALCLLMAILPPALWAEPGTGEDQRIALGLSAAEKTAFLAEMRQMLASVQGIIAAIGVGDREAIAAAARMSGNRMARATPATVRAKLPQAFKEIGGPTHLLFEEIAIRAGTDDMADLTVLTGETLRQCVACHAQFRAD